AIRVPEIKGKTGGVEQVDLLLAGEDLDGVGAAGRRPERKATVGKGESAAIGEQVVEARAHAAGIRDVEHGTVEGEIAVHLDVVAGAEGLEVGAGRAELEIELGALGGGQVTADAERADAPA